MGNSGKQFAEDAARVLNARVDDLVERMAPLGGKARLPSYASVHQQYGGEWHATAASVEFDVEGGGMMRVGFPSIAGSSPYVELHFDLKDVDNATMTKLIGVMRGQ